MRRRKPGAVILERDHHSISRRDIDPDALKVLYRLSSCHHLAYLAGGAVRDLLLGRAPKDFDITTSAHPNEVKKLFKNCFLIGRRFRLAHIRFGTKIIECSTFRKEPEPVDATNEEESSLYQHRNNDFGTPEEDAARRDFTVNGIFYSIDKFRIIDYVGGLDDLKKKVIRTIGEPGVRMQEDPVRMLRAIRFASRLKFTIERRTWKAILKYHKEILKASPARLTEEIQRLFTYKSGHDAMRLMKESGLLKDLLPWVDHYLSKASDKGKLFWSCLAALDSTAPDDSAPPSALVFASMCYPMFLEKYTAAQKKDPRVRALDIAQEVLTDKDGKTRIAKMDFYRVCNILDSQHRFETWTTGRFSKQKFVGRMDFKVAADFYEVQATARGLDIPAHRPWKQLYKESGKSERLDENGKPARTRRRGGRRRRDPKRIPENTENA